MLSCHLDHQRPGANDNASGCATILEVARTLSKLIANGKIARPSRSIRFVWPCEVECTLALFHSQPEMRARFKAVIHMDMVGGGPVTKAIFHVTRGPASLPSFVYDVGQRFGTFLNSESQLYAEGTGGKYPMVSGEGGKEPLLGDLAEFSMGSDHELYEEASWKIPGIYLNDWPDRYIHTNFDVPGEHRPDEAAARGIHRRRERALSREPEVVGRRRALGHRWSRRRLRRAATMLDRRATLSPADGAALTRSFLSQQHEAFESIATFAAIPDSVRRAATAFFQRLETMTGAPEARSAVQRRSCRRLHAQRGGRGANGGVRLRLSRPITPRVAPRPSCSIIRGCAATATSTPTRCSTSWMASERRATSAMP